MEARNASSEIDRIKEILSKRTAVIGISGPSGAGKDYLTQKAIEYFSGEGIQTFNVQMVTEREHRGAVETKICVSPQEYDKLQRQGKLVGDHINKVRYGYQTDEIEKALHNAQSVGGMVILELNPSKQKSFPAELKNKVGVDLTAWIGVETTLEQTRANMEERGEPEVVIQQRLQTMSDFVESMERNKNIKLVNNGPENRANAHTDFINIIKESILD